MKKLIAIITVILCLGFSTAFASDIVYNGFVQGSGKWLAVLDNEIYEIGDTIIDRSNCKVSDITQKYVTLTCDEEKVTVYFKKP